MSERLCPFGDGRHKRMRWFEKDAGGRRPLVGGRQGESCIKCHKTWEWHGDQLVPTWKD